uniref:Uncharacterized protein n=1 Tax=Rhizophora mucronata TaxID=61149 RepID=A0A2P2Q8N8_RHIMU
MAQRYLDLKILLSQCLSTMDSIHDLIGLFFSLIQMISKGEMKSSKLKSMQ